MSEDQLGQAPPATNLDATADDALRGVEVPPIDLDDGWRVISATSERLALLNERDASDTSSDGSTHDVLVVGWFPDINGDGPGWHLEESGRCTLRRQLPAGLGAADLALEPERPLDPTSAQLHLVAIEQACSSSRVATDRLKVVVQEVTADTVELLVGIRPVEGAAECAGNPPTPFTVDLGQPLGDRVPVDIGRSPPRHIPPASELDDFPD